MIMTNFFSSTFSYSPSLYKTFLLFRSLYFPPILSGRDLIFLGIGWSGVFRHQNKTRLLQILEIFLLTNLCFISDAMAKEVPEKAKGVTLNYVQKRTWSEYFSSHEFRTQVVPISLGILGATIGIGVGVYFHQSLIRERLSTFATLEHLKKQLSDCGVEKLSWKQEVFKVDQTIYDCMKTLTPLQERLKLFQPLYDLCKQNLAEQYRLNGVLEKRTLKAISPEEMLVMTMIQIAANNVTK